MGLRRGGCTRAGLWELPQREGDREVLVKPSWAGASPQCPCLHRGCAAEHRGKKLDAGSQRPVTCAARGAQGDARRAACRGSAQRCCCCGHSQSPAGAGGPSAHPLSGFSVNIHIRAQGEGRMV